MLRNLIYVFLYQNLNADDKTINITENTNLCISILEFKQTFTNGEIEVVEDLCISILEFK